MVSHSALRSAWPELLISAGGDVLQWRRSLLDARSLQQLLLQPQAVIWLSVCVWTGAQQWSWSCTQRSVRGKIINFSSPETMRWRIRMKSIWYNVPAVFTFFSLSLSVSAAHNRRFCQSGLVDISSCVVSPRVQMKNKHNCNTQYTHTAPKETDGFS